MMYNSSSTLQTVVVPLLLHMFMCKVTLIFKILNLILTSMAICIVLTIW